MSGEGRTLAGIVGLVVLLFLLFNPSILIGVLVWITAGVFLAGGFAVCVFLMFLILKELFK